MYLIRQPIVILARNSSKLAFMGKEAGNPWKIYTVSEAGEGAANYVLDHAQLGDAILFHIAEARVPYEFFKSIRANVRSGIGVDGPEIIYPRHGDRLDYQDFTGKPSGELVQSASGHHSRVWVVLMSNGTLGHPDATTVMLNQTLGESFPRVERVQFPQVEVRLYSRP